MNRRRILRSLPWLVLVTLLLVTCARREPVPPTVTVQPGPEADGTPAAVEQTPTPDPLPESGAVLVLMAGPIDTLEPYHMVGSHPEGSVASHLWDTLTFLNDELKIEPHLAESWRLINNFTWEVTLRQGITFHNGEPFNARAARASIERAQSMPGSLEVFAHDVRIEQVEVVDDYVLRIMTADPVSNLPYHLASVEMLPPAYYAETDPRQLADAPVGSGPYRVIEWVPGDQVVLEAVPSYWKGPPSRERLVFRTVVRAEDRLAALRSGEMVLVTGLEPAHAAQRDLAPARVEAIASTQRMLVGIHVTEGSPLEDRRVRQALNYALDVQQIINDWLQGYGERYGSWVNPPGNDPTLSPWPYDPDRARTLLAEAGYPNGFVTALYAPGGVYTQGVDIAQAIAEQWGQVGVTAKVEVVDWVTYVRDLLSDPPPLFLLAMNSRGDALDDVANLSADFAFNPTGWRDERFEQSLRRAASSFNEASRSRFLNEAQAIAYEEAPWVWLWRSYHFYGLSQDLDWTPRPDGLVYLYQSE